MRNAFRGYYSPPEDELKQLWDNGLFVFDANVLLNIYRYSPETSGKLLAVMEGVRERLWIPYQAALEYQEHRLDVIGAQRKAYDDIEGILQDAQRKLEEYVNRGMKLPRARLGQSPAWSLKGFDALNLLVRNHPAATDPFPLDLEGL